MKYDVDSTLLSDVRKFGTFDATGCFNCGTCTLSCDLAGDDVSFPRRSMRQVLMGQRQLVHESLDPWICHDCGDCSRVCPRQTAPRDSMMTLRRYLASVYDWTGIASKINSSKAWYFGSLILVALIITGLIFWYHVYELEMGYYDFVANPMGLEHMFPMMTWFTVIVVVFPFFILLTNAFRMYWITVHKKDYIHSPVTQWLIEIKTFFYHFFTYRKMVECATEKSRWPKHMLIGIGTIIMLIVVVFALKWFQTDNIYPFYHPQRWIGYIATAFIVFGTGDVLISRIMKKREIHKTSDFRDWPFPIMLMATAVSGILVHIFRYAGLEYATHYTYAIHIIITVPMLVIEMAFGKWTHMIYRPLAMYFQSLKEKTVEQAEPVKEVPDYV